MKKKRASASSVGSGSLEEQALSQLDSGNYKEAIVLYKKLLQEAENKKWHEKLAFCYLQRAFAFANREMYKEAMVLWGNYTQHTQDPSEAYEYYVIWVIQTKNKDNISACLTSLSSEQVDKQYPMLATVLGLLMLTEYPELQQSLPQGSALIAHYNMVQSALEAYQNNDLDELAIILKQLPYRSAFRDFRTLINAALISKTSTEQMQELLGKISATSPYSQAAKLMRASSLEGVELTQGLMPFSHKQQKIVGDIKGLSKKQLQFVDQLTRHNDQMTDKVKFDLALKFRSLCDSELSQQFCQAILMTYPAGNRQYKKNFSLGKSSEESRLKALSHGFGDDFYEAEGHWMACVNSLLKEGEEDSELKAALIMRYVSAHLPPPEQTNLLIQSLGHDPDDRDCYLKILHNYSHQRNDEKDYKQWLDRTLKQFPEDIEVLNLAVQSARQSKAYKKATQYATKILKIDSLNTNAKQTLFFCHLAHAKGLIKSKKYTLVEKEIMQADRLKMDKKHGIKIQLIRGMYCFAAQDKKEGLTLITDALNALNVDPVNTHFQAAMEVQLSGLPVATILRGLPESKGHLLTQAELMVLVQSLEYYAEQEDNQELVHKALAKIKPALKKAVQEQTYDEEKVVSLCQILDRFAHFELLRHCAKLSFSKKWKSAVWAYYQVYADTNGNPEECSFQQLLRLQANQEQASKEKDQRAMMLIEKYLQQYYQSHPERGTEFFEDLFADDLFVDEDEDDDPIGDLFGHVSDEMFRKIDKKITVLFKKVSPETLAKSIAKSCNVKPKQILQAMMENPDLFTSLMVIHAVDQLDMDVGVSTNDVLERFAVGEENSSFPFSFPFPF